MSIEGIASPFRLTGYLRDISSDGLSFRACPNAEVALSKTNDVNVSFTLPGAELLKFCVRIRHRDLIGYSSCYGTWFDDERTDDFREKQEVVVAFVAACRSESIDAMGVMDRSSADDEAYPTACGRETPATTASGAGDSPVEWHPVI